jgi:hypothetical protein
MVFGHRAEYKAKMPEKSIPELVDELGAIADKLKKIDVSKLTKRADAIKKLLREHAEKRKPKPEKVVKVAGTRYVAEVGAQPPAKSIRSMPKLFKLMGQKLFLELCSVTIAKIEKNLTPAQCDDILEKGYAKTRPVTVQGK